MKNQPITEAVAVVRIRVVLDVTTGARYGADWTMAAIAEQASKEAKMMLQHRLKESLLKIVEEPVVTACMVTEEHK